MARSPGGTLGVLLAALSVVSGRISVDPVSQRFVDESGCVRVFHGVNAVYKVAPYFPQLEGFDPVNSLSDTDLAFLASQGMNVIRLGVLWNAVQPAPGVVNETYVAVMRDLVERAGSYGIHTLVDAHQDLMSPQFCGEGVPDHAVETSPGSVNGSLFGFPSPIPVSLQYGPDGYPLTADCLKVMFGAYYFSFACASAWQSLYDNATLGAYLADYWVSVASAFVGMDSVLGYELLNEPWVGDFYKYPLHALVPGEADVDNLVPLYDKLYAALRKVDNDTIVFYEPSVHESYFYQATGFTSGPGGHADDSKQAFAYHVYCENQNATGDITNITDCASNLAASWAIARSNVAKVGGGSMLTEFGAVGVHESSIESIGILCDHADTALESWSYWTFKSYQDITTQNGATESWYNADGSIQSPKVAALSRTYAPSIAGLPSSISMSYNTTTSAFVLSYTINSAATGTTTIFLNEALNYPRGFYTAVTPPASATIIHRATNFLDVAVAVGASGVLTVVVRSK